jgi:hypothetical protein
VRCPVSASDASHKRDRKQRKSRIDQRTRERLPLLPALVAWAQAERDAAAQRLHAAAAAGPGEMFTAGGQDLRRAVMRTAKTTGRIWATSPAGGKRRDLTYEEHRAFWAWALIEVLRHTGIRIEELSELTHHSLIQYRLPATGELIPLLQIAPSKTDEERLLVVSPNWPTCYQRSCPASAARPAPSPWPCSTTTPSAPSTRPCRCCSNGGSGWKTGPSPRNRCATTSTTPWPHPASPAPVPAQRTTPPTTSAGSSSPTRSPTGCRRTSPS